MPSLGGIDIGMESLLQGHQLSAQIINLILRAPRPQSEVLLAIVLNVGPDEMQTSKLQPFRAAMPTALTVKNLLRITD